MRPHISLLLVVAATFTLHAPATAFDTGHHADLTRDAMLAEGFQQTPINVAIVENWLTDYYSNTAGRQDELGLLHFDNLTDATAVQNYWDTFTLNAWTAVTAAAKERNAPKLVVLLGISLHAVQDFYTHSNWVELHPRQSATDPFQTVTWFDTPRTAVRGMALRSGRYPNRRPIDPLDHGDYFSGMNHDSYCRPRWAEAYVHAFAASRHWIRTFAQWTEAAQPGLWVSVATLSLNPFESSALDQEQLAAYRVSEWVGPVPIANGHWKGIGSGSDFDFATFMAGYKLRSRSIFANYIMDQKWDLELSKGLASPGTPNSSPPAVAPWRSLYTRAVIVKTKSVRETETGTFESRLDTGANPEFYAIVTIDGLTYVEAMQFSKAAITPFWTSIRFISAEQRESSVRYVLYDEDDPPSNPDDSCDVNPTVGVTDLNFKIDPMSGLIMDRNPPSNRLSSAGARPDKDRAAVQLEVAATLLADVEPVATPDSPPIDSLPIRVDPTFGAPQPDFATRGSLDGDRFVVEWRNLAVYRTDLRVHVVLEFRAVTQPVSSAQLDIRLELDDTDVRRSLHSGAPNVDWTRVEFDLNAPPDPRDSRELGVSLKAMLTDTSDDEEKFGDISVSNALGTLIW